MERGIEKLTMAFLEGDLSDEDARHLTGHLKSNPEDAGEFFALARQERLLQFIYSPAAENDVSQAVIAEILNSRNGEEFISGVLERLPVRQPAASGKRVRRRNSAHMKERYHQRMAQRRRRTVIAIAAAAAVIVVLTLAVAIFSGSPAAGPRDEIPVAKRPERPTPQPPTPQPPTPEPETPEPETPEPETPEPEPEDPPAPPSLETELAAELEWLKAARVSPEPGPGEGVLQLAKEEPRQGAEPTEGGPRDGGPPTEGGQDKPPVSTQDKIASFLKQFDFALRIPSRLPGGYELRSARAVSRKSLWLLYEGGLLELTVFVSQSSGKDTDFTEVDAADRSLVAGRRSGLLIGFEGLLEEEKAQTLAKLFAPEKGKEEEKKDE